MASEVEDCGSFEADCLPTGSISFGRFEGESLTWERRSSFSHNRYLEEVEKYSTPGSVIKKKAYFEAHFKKTALRNLDLFGRQNETDGQAENDMEGEANCVKEFRDHGNGELRFEDFEDHENPGVQFSWYDETPDVSDEEQHKIMEAEKHKELSSSELPVKVANGNDGTHEPVSQTNLQQDETVKTSSECDMAEQVTDGVDVTVEEKAENILENANAEKMDASGKNTVARKVHVSSLKKVSKASHMAKSTMEQKSRKMKSGMDAPATHTKRKISTETIHSSTGVSSAKGSNKMEKGIPVRLKQSSSKPSPSTLSAPQNMKSEDFGKMKVKLRAENRSSFNSEKGDNTNGALVPPSRQVDGRKSTNRDKRVTNTMKLGTRMSGAVFSFKSDERAEKRKEFYMKLEEKQQTKEVELTEIQVKKQEESDAEIKQFRRSLNFKATPMPSFYHGAGPKASDGQKAISGPSKSLKLQSRCTTPGSRSTARANSPTLSKSSNPRGASAASEHPGTAQQECLANLEGDNSHPAVTNGGGKAVSATALKQTSETDKRIDAAKKEDRTKANLQQQQGVGKVKKRDGVSSVRRSGVGKVIKGMAAGSMAVRVAS